MDTVRVPAEAVLPEPEAEAKPPVPVTRVERGETTDVDPLTPFPTLRRGSLPVGEPRTVLLN